MFIRETVSSGLTEAQGFQALEQRYQNGELPFNLNPFLFSYLFAALQISGLFPNQNLSDTLPEYDSYCEVQGNYIRVVGNNVGLGFMEAERIEPTVYQEEGATVVQICSLSRGFWIAQPLQLPCKPIVQKSNHEGEYYIVKVNACGYMVAEDIPYEYKAGMLTVNRTLVEEGYWKAEELPSPNEYWEDEEY